MQYTSSPVFVLYSSSLHSFNHLLLDSFRNFLFLHQFPSLASFSHLALIKKFNHDFPFHPFPTQLILYYNYFDSSKFRSKNSQEPHNNKISNLAENFKLVATLFPDKLYLLVLFSIDCFTSIVQPTSNFSTNHILSKPKTPLVEIYALK